MTGPRGGVERFSTLEMHDSSRTTGMRRPQFGAPRPLGAQTRLTLWALVRVFNITNPKLEPGAWPHSSNLNIARRRQGMEEEWHVHEHFRSLLPRLL